MFLGSEKYVPQLRVAQLNWLALLHFVWAFLKLKQQLLRLNMQEYSDNWEH